MSGKKFLPPSIYGSLVFLAAIALMAYPSVKAQTVLIDFGSTTYTNTIPDANGNYWNNYTNLAQSNVLLGLNSVFSGTASGISAIWTNGSGLLVNGDSSGGSATLINNAATLAGWYNPRFSNTAMVADIWYSPNAPVLVFTNLNSNETYDLTLAEFRLNSGSRAGQVIVSGSNSVTNNVDGGFVSTVNGTSSSYGMVYNFAGINPTSSNTLSMMIVQQSPGTNDCFSGLQLVGYVAYTNGVTSTISSAKSYSGDTYLGGNASITASAAGALGNGSSTLVSFGSSTVTLNGSGQTVAGLAGSGNLNLAASGGSQTLTVNSSWGTNNKIYYFSTNAVTNGVTNAGFTINNLNYGQANVTNTTGSTTNVSGWFTNNYSTYSGVLSGSAALQKSGTGTLFLTGNNTYTGGTVVSGGTLSITSSNNIASGALTMNGGTLSFTSLLTLSSFINSSPSSMFNYTTLASGAGTTTLLTASSLSLGGNALSFTSATLGANTLTLNGSAVSYLGYSYLFTNSGNNLSIVATASGRAPWNLSWAGGDATWNTTAGVWYATNNGASTNVFQDYDNVTFTNGSSVSVQVAGVNAGAVLLTNNSGTLTLSNGAIAAASFTNAGSGNVVVSSSLNILNGTGTLVNSGSGTLSLNASNSVAASVLSAGKTVLGNANALGGTSASLTMSGGALDLNGNSINSGALNISAGSVTNSSASLATFGNAGGGTVAGTIDGNIALVKSGAGNLILSGANTFNGGVTINAGTLSITNSGTLGAATNAVTLNAGTLDLGNKKIALGSMTLTGGTVQNGTISNTAVAMSGVSTINAILAGSSSLNYTANGGPAALGASNSFTGGIVFNNINLNLNLNNAYALGTGTLTFAAGTYANLNFVQGASTVANNTMFFSNNGTLAANDYNATVTLGGNLIIDSNSTAKFNPTAGTTLLNGVISGDSSSTANNYGSGTLALGAANTFSGTWNLGNYAVTTASYTLLNNTNAMQYAILGLNGQGTNQINVLFGANGGSNSIYNIGGLGGGQNGLATLNLTNGNSISINSTRTNNQYFTGIIAGTGSLIVNDLSGSDLALSSFCTNTYSGGTVINSGQLTVQNGSALGSGGVTVSGGWLNLFGKTITNSLAGLSNGGWTVSYTHLTLPTKRIV